NTTVVRVPLAALAALLDRLGRCEPAATIAGHAFNPVTRPWLPELRAAIAHLREVLGDQTYESLAHKGEAMTISAMVTYAYDQIDQARAELNAVSK
ncbi:MAG TPA: adenylate/guanylate cyclase domain-containing protein, partial [Candidatus Angelobacter sp.]|nr:adenylate/guanylate cyclase domain-containing protein [Candidatus Angelobacter sp.]